MEKSNGKNILSTKNNTYNKKKLKSLFLTSTLMKIIQHLKSFLFLSRTANLLQLYLLPIKIQKLQFTVNIQAKYLTTQISHYGCHDSTSNHELQINP